MAVEAVAGISPVRELLLSTVENARKAAQMLSPEEVWTCADAEVDDLLRLHAQLESVTAAIGHLIVRDADVRDLAVTAGVNPPHAGWRAS